MISRVWIYVSLNSERSGPILLFAIPGEVSWWPSGENLWWWPAAFSCSTTHPNAGQECNPTYCFFWFQQVCNFPVGLTCHYYPKTYIKQSTQLLFAIGGCGIITPHSPTYPPSSPSPPLPRHLPMTKIGWWLTWEPSVAFCGRKGTGEILFPCSEKALTD